jgi:hypothetical protein
VVVPVLLELLLFVTLNIAWLSHRYTLCKLRKAMEQTIA